MTPWIILAAVGFVVILSVALLCYLMVRILKKEESEDSEEIEELEEIELLEGTATV